MWNCSIHWVSPNNVPCITSECCGPASTHLSTMCYFLSHDTVGCLVILFKDNSKIFTQCRSKVQLFVAQQLSITIITGCKRQQRNYRTRWMWLVNKPSYKQYKQQSSYTKLYMCYQFPITLFNRNFCEVAKWNILWCFVKCYFMNVNLVGFYKILHV